MLKYPRETVAEVLAANDIVDVIGGVLELKPSGAGRFKALCPFHHEKTPSFTVNRLRQIYHCFGCGKGGDVLSFLMEFEGSSFSETLQKLAERGAVRLPALTERNDSADLLRKRLYEFGAFAARTYTELLAHPMRGSAARQYLKARQLRDETMRRFGLGFAPESWSTLLDAARQQGFNEEVLRAAGLFKTGERGGMYDFFRNRVIFPIKDVNGNIVAFGGRDLGDSPAKYINSPETPVYKKSRVLYGLNEAREAIRKARCAILVEGYFDALRCYDAGIDNVVATCGTALTSEQAALLRRYAPEVVVVYDGDQAGINAALKGTGLLMQAGLNVKALVLPEGNDPDDFIKARGREAFLRLVEEADGFLTFLLRNNVERMKTIEGRTEVVHGAFDLITLIEDITSRESLVKLVATELGLQPWNVTREFERYQASKRNAWRPALVQAPETVSENTSFGQDDCDFVAGLLADPGVLESARQKLASITMEPAPLTEVLAKLLKSNDGNILHELEGDAARQLYSIAANSEPAAKDLRDLAEKRINRIEREALRRQVEAVKKELQDAQRVQDREKTTELLILHTELLHRIEEVGAA